MGSPPEHVTENRRLWDHMADDWVAAGEAGWASEEPFWGIWRLPESSLRLLPEDLAGQRAIELGCGTGYVSGWLARRGADVVGIDSSERQLATARRLATAHGVSLELHHGNAEQVPEPTGSFDFAISEYGAVTWCDPRIWVAEAGRLLRPGGRLVMLGNSPLSMVCMPDSGDRTVTTLERSYFDLHRLDWREAEEDPGGIEFNLPVSGWFQLFRECGFQVDDYRELQPPEGNDEEFRFYVTRAWARRFPAEHAWRLTRRS